MAQTRDFPLHSHKVPRSRATKYSKTLMIPAALALAALSAPSAHAQLQQPLVFSSAGAVASRNDQTGALTPVSGSPFASRSPLLAFRLLRHESAGLHRRRAIGQAASIATDSIDAERDLSPHFISRPRCGKSSPLRRLKRATLRPAQR